MIEQLHGSLNDEHYFILTVNGIETNDKRIAISHVTFTIINPIFFVSKTLACSGWMMTMYLENTNQQSKDLL